MTMRWWVDREGRRVDVAVRPAGENREIAFDGRVLKAQMIPVSGSLDALLCSDGRSFSVASRKLGAGRWRISLGDREFEITLRDPLERELAARAGAAGPQEIRAPIPGKVVRIEVAAGDEVEPGQPLLVLEAMKMENQICAEGAGTVDDIRVAAGATVEGGQILITLQ